MKRVNGPLLWGYLNQKKINRTIPSRGVERGSRELEKSKMSRNTPRRGVEDVKIDKIDENDVIEKVKNQEIDDFEEKESL